MPTYNLTPQQRTRAEQLWREDRLASVIVKLAEEVIFLRDEVDSLRAFKAGVDEALNSGDGVYRP